MLLTEDFSDQLLESGTASSKDAILERDPSDPPFLTRQWLSQLQGLTCGLIRPILTKHQESHYMSAVIVGEIAAHPHFGIASGQEELVKRIVQLQGRLPSFTSGPRLALVH